MSALVIIPARMASVRLPGKPLADIAGLPMVVHVLRAAEAAGVGPVAVAAAEQDVVDAVEAAGGRAVLTDPALPSGSDRVWAAAQRLDPDAHHDVIVNVQGDLPTLTPQAVSEAVAVITAGTADIATIVSPSSEEKDRTDPGVVKAIIAWDDTGRRGRALYFTRANAPTGEGEIWRHLGLYAFRRDALARFTALPPSPLERRERLEQLRALEAGMRIDAGLTDDYALGVDTPEDLVRARTILHDREVAPARA